MRRIVVAIALLVTGALVWTNPVEAQVARKHPRNVYCRYRSVEPGGNFTAREVKLTIACAAKKWGVSLSTAYYVADRESNYSWWAQNRWSGACGIFQHLPRYWGGRLAHFRDRHPFWRVLPSCFNARTNVLVTIDMAQQGWGPWGM